MRRFKRQVQHRVKTIKKKILPGDLYFNFLLWPIALILLYIITSLSVTGIFIAFEFLLRILSGAKFFFYFIIIVSALTLLQSLSILLTGILCGLPVLIVRQRKSLITVFGILFSLEIIVLIIIFWAGVIQFSWESLPYKGFNKFLFSIIFLSLIYVPIRLGATKDFE